MMTLRHITAAEVHHQQREREREREREKDVNQKEKERNSNRKREKDKNIFHDWIRHCNIYFYNLVKNNHIETEKRKKKSFKLRNKKIKIIFVSKVLSNNPSPRLEKFRWPVMIVKLRKGQQKLKKFENANFNKILVKFKILIRILSLSQETIRYPCF